MKRPTHRINLELAKEVGIKAAAIFELIYDEYKEKNYEGFVKLPVKLVQEYGMTEAEQRGALAKLVKAGLIEKPVVKGMPSFRHVRFTDECFNELKKSEAYAQGI